MSGSGFRLDGTLACKVQGPFLPCDKLGIRGEPVSFPYVLDTEAVRKFANHRLTTLASLSSKNSRPLLPIRRHIRRLPAADGQRSQAGGIDSFVVVRHRFWISRRAFKCGHAAPYERRSDVYTAGTVEGLSERSQFSAMNLRTDGQQARCAYLPGSRGLVAAVGHGHGMI